MVDLITENLDLWSSAYIAKKTVGRGNSTRLDAYGIQKLRELILQLAVMGKLVPQDQNDEPANILLEKIELEKERLFKEGTIRKQPKFSEITDDEKLFDSPNGWIWARLGSLGLGNTGKTPETKYAEFYNGNIQFIGPGQITSDGKLLQSDKTLTELGSEYSTVSQSGDILMVCIGGSIGKSVIVYSEVAYNQQINGLTPIYVNSELLNYFMQTDTFQTALLENSTGSATPIINRGKWEELILPIPPKEEQRRIVAKVDELMALCDCLEEQQNESRETHQTLVETLLNTLISVKGTKEFQKSWDRIAEHFDILFTTEQSIDTLKQTILQLAVMGKLVLQDPSDEPATVLLEKIAQGKEKLVKEGKIKKQTKLPKVSEDEKIFDLPSGWAWCHLQDIVYILGDGLHGTPQYTPDEKYFFINGNNLNDGKIVIKADTKTVSHDQYLKYKKNLGENTVLVSINGTLGNVAFYNNEDIVLGKSACYFNLVNGIEKLFIKILIESPFFYTYAFHNATGSTIKNLGLQAMNNLSIGLPPVSEQQRIIDKVNELMTLCDTLKQHIEDARSTQIHLADAIVEQAVTRA